MSLAPGFMVAAMALLWFGGPRAQAADPADLNQDGAINRADMDLFESCHSGPDVPLAAGSPCGICDLDADGDADVTDFAVLQRALTGRRGTPQIEIVLEWIDKQPALVGQQLALRLTVRNVGDGPASSVLVDVNLPDTLQFVSSTPLAAAARDQVVSVTVGDLAAGAGVRTTILVKSLAAGEAQPSATLRGDEAGAPVRVDANAALEIQNEYLEIISTTARVPLLPCGAGVVGPLLTSAGLLLLAAPRRGRRRAA